MESSISSRIESIVGHNISAFARKSGIGESLLRQYITGTKPGFEKAIAIAKAGNVSLDWLATGIADSSSVPTQLSDDVSTYKAVHVSALCQTKVKDGGDVESETVSLLLGRKWLEKKGMTPADVFYMCMPDDSMQPTIPEGGIVVVDGREKLSTDGVHAVMYGSTLVVKRLQTEFDGGLLIRSDNRNYGEQHIKPDDVSKLSIIGRVIWVGGEI